MNTFLNRTALAFAGLLIALGGLFAPQTQAQRHTADIVDTAVAAGSFTTLATALTEAGLVETLKGDGPFTVFAPTDAAFAALPEGTVASLLKPENRDQLVAILTYHVVPGRVMAEQVVGLKTAGTVNGQQVDVAVRNGKVFIDKAEVITTDIQASNGVIHVIDQVLMPVTETIPAVAQKAGQFGTLLTAVKAAGLAEALMGDGPFTVFAPTDAAFAALPEGTVASLLKPENRDQLTAILTYHVVPGRLFAADVLSQRVFDTLGGERLMASQNGNTVKIGTAGLVATDIEASNGVIHVIDGVLLPPETTSQAVSPRSLIEMAIDRGVPLFNNGQHMATTAVYEMTAEALLAMDGVSADAKRPLRQALQQMRSEHMASDQAWALRRGLDAAYTTLRQESMQMTSRH